VRISTLVKRALPALAFFSLVHASTSLAQGELIDSPPESPDDGALVAVEFAMISASAVTAIYNGRLAVQGKRSLFWSLAGTAVGAATLWASASNESKMPAADVVAGIAAVVTSVARLPRLHEEPHARSTMRTLELNQAPGGLGVRMRF
jgi:hypothetical protein